MTVTLERYGERNCRRIYRTKKCRRAACTKRFRPKRKERFCCLECQDLHVQEVRRWSRFAPRRTQSDAKHGPKITAGFTNCACPSCGKKLCEHHSYGSDPMTGRGTVYCPECGEQPIVPIGTRAHDQRATLEAEMEIRVGSANRRVRKPKYATNQGDAWRQASHKKGIVGHLTKGAESGQARQDPISGDEVV